MTVVTPRVLVVSESRITRRVVEMTFADQQVELVVAASGQAGLEAWDAHVAAVVLVDAAMETPDGLAMARHVQATAHGRHAAVLLMAGQHDAVDAGEMARADVRGVIRKPLDSLQLIEAVREVIRTARAPKPAPVEGPRAVDGPAPAVEAAVIAVEAAPLEPDAAALVPESVATAPALTDEDLERVAARVASIWGGGARYEARVQELVAARAQDLAAVSAAAAVARVAPAATSEAAERLVRELAPVLVQQVARLVVMDVTERLVREEIARMRSAHQAR